MSSLKEVLENTEKVKTENGTFFRRHDKVDQLKAENARLRELVSEAHSCKTNDGCCEDCYREEGCCPVERRMQELGIEVD